MPHLRDDGGIGNPDFEPHLYTTAIRELIGDENMNADRADSVNSSMGLHPWLFFAGFAIRSERSALEHLRRACCVGDRAGNKRDVDFSAAWAQP